MDGSTRLIAFGCDHCVVTSLAPLPLCHAFLLYLIKFRSDCGSKITSESAIPAPAQMRMETKYIRKADHPKTLHRELGIVGFQSRAVVVVHHACERALLVLRGVMKITPVGSPGQFYILRTVHRLKSSVDEDHYSVQYPMSQ